MELIRVAKIIDNVDELQKGRVQLRVMPEMNGVKDSELPWCYPYIIKGGGDSNKTGEHNIPEINEMIKVIIRDKFWQIIEWLPGDYVEGFYPYSEFSFILSSATELGSMQYPEPKFMRKFKDGTALFHNSTTGETGIINKNGSYFIFDVNGNMINNAKSKKIKIKNTLADIYDILIRIEELLDDIISNSNWIGNWGFPTQFMPFGVDKLKVQQIKTDVDNLFKI